MRSAILPLICTACALALPTLTGCGNPWPDTSNSNAAPPDFALHLFVDAEQAGWQRAIFVLQPDRTLRTGFGRGEQVTFDTFPAVRRRLSPAEFQRVYAYVDEHDLTKPPVPLSLNDVNYKIAITANGRTVRHEVDSRSGKLRGLMNLLAEVGHIELQPIDEPE